GSELETKAERRWLRKNLTNAEYVIFEAIEDAAGLVEDGFGQVSYGALALACNVGATAVVRCIERLVGLGLLEVRARKGFANGYRPVQVDPTLLQEATRPPGKKKAGMGKRYANS